MFKKWTPIESLPKTLYLEAVHDDWEGFRLLLKHDEARRILRITFNPPLSYRNTDEGDLLKSINEQDLGGWSLYVVSSSDYLAWFSDQSCGIHEPDDVVHYAIYTPNDCVDVLSAHSPTVEWLNQ